MTTTIASRRSAARERAAGSVLVLALLVSLILLGLGLTALYLSSEGGKVSTGVSRRGEAYFSAKSGLERARAILHDSTTWINSLSGCPTSPAWDPVRHVDVVKGRVLCAAGAPLYRVRLLEASTQSATKAAAVSSVEYTLWIRNDDEEGGAANILTDNNTRVIVRAEAQARNRLGFVALEQIIGRGAGGSLPEAAYSQAGMGPTGANSGKAALGP